MNQFCFIIPRTPASYKTPLREFLWQTCVRALRAQEYENWIAIVIGEKEEGFDNRFVFLEYDLVPKRQKLQYALDWLAQLDKKPEYLIRLDDDDIFSTTILKDLADTDADAIGDEYHSFFEITSGRISQQKRNWLANTILHRYEHAVCPVEDNDYTGALICHDHSPAWHMYYAGRKLKFTTKGAPIYLRILSPGTITSRLADNGSPGDPYMNYLLGFGDWMIRPSQLTGFEQAVADLKKGVGAAGDFGLPNLKWPVLRLWKNRWLDIRQNWLR